MILGKHKNNKPKELREAIEFNNLLFCFLIALPAITAIVNGTVRMFISARKLDTLMIYGILAIILLKSLPRFKLKISREEFIVIYIYMIIWVGSYFLNSEGDNVKNEIIMDIITSCLFIWVASHEVHISYKMIAYLRITAYILILRYPIDLYLLSNRGIGTSYSQYAGYQLYTGFTMLLIPMLLYKRWYDYIIGALCALFTITTGARGPFVFLVCSYFICLFLISNNKNKIIKNFLPIAVVIIIITVNMQSIMNIILNLVQKTGGSVRTIRTIMNGNIFTYIGGRNTIYRIVWEYILKHPFWGTGFINDRIYINNQIGNWGDATGFYAHNLFLEIGMQFGIIIGIIVIIFLTNLIIVTFRHQQTIEERLFYTALSCSAILPLIVSESYLTSQMVYALLGFSFASLHRKQGE